jgi:hypothetical protein
MSTTVTIIHPVFGNIRPAPAPGTAFQPLAYLADPGRFAEALAYFRRRAARFGVGSGLPRAHRESALDDAAQTGLRRLIDRNYSREGITETEHARAIIGTARFCDRSHWRSGEGQRQENRKRGPGNVSRFPNPATLAALAERYPAAVEVLVGELEGLPAGTVDIPGGHGRPRGDGKMIQRDDGRWVMDRRYGKDQTYPATTAVVAGDAVANRHTPTPMPMTQYPAMPGDGTAWRPIRD